MLQCLRLCFPETDSEMMIPVKGFPKEVVTGRIGVCAEKIGQEQEKPHQSEVSGRVPQREAST